jgi:hypothetical protein
MVIGMAGKGNTIRFKHLDGLRGLFAVTVAFNHILGSMTGWALNRPFSGA